MKMVFISLLHGGHNRVYLYDFSTGYNLYRFPYFSNVIYHSLIV